MTYTAVVFGSNALDIRDDIATISANSIQSFCDINDFRNGEYIVGAYASYEPNYWLLDGNYKFPPSSHAKAGWISANDKMTQSSTNFAASPVPELTIYFNDVHSTDGLTLHFPEYTGDYMDYVRVVFYDASDVGIRDDFYIVPAGGTFFTNQPVANFKHILIGLHSSNKAYRFGRLLSVDFDVPVEFARTDVLSASLLEEIDPIAATLSINSFECKLYS